MQHLNSLTRAKQIIEARLADPEAAAKLEKSFAGAMVGPNALARDTQIRAKGYPQHGYLSPFAATEVFAKELHDGMTQLAVDLKVRSPKSGKYDPLFATPTLFGEVWRARQVVDELGIPYSFFIAEALRYWKKLANKRLPRPLQLCVPEILAFVLKSWGRPHSRYLYPMFDGSWSMQFHAGNYVGDAQQVAALGLIDQRIADARMLGLDPAAALAPFLMEAINMDEAARRYGQDLVERATDWAAQNANDAAEVEGKFGFDSGA